MNHQHPPCIPCGVRTFRRNTYFNGKLLTERDLRAEQDYLVGKDRLHNSLLHGTGTVCGLKVTAHPNPECRDRFVVLEPGAALDCCGREIVVPERVLLPLLDLIETEELTALLQGGPADLFLGLCYREALEEKVPVILPDCDCADADQAYNRIAEGYRVHVFTADAAALLPARPRLRARLDWRHTLALARQSPRAVAVDDQLGQLYVAAQAILPDEGEDEGDLGARLYVFDTATHDLLTALDAFRNPADIALSLLGDLVFLAADELPLGDGEAGPGIAVFREGDLRRDAAPAALIARAGPARPP